MFVIINFFNNIQCLLNVAKKIMSPYLDNMHMKNVVKYILLTSTPFRNMLLKGTLSYSAWRSSSYTTYYCCMHMHALHVIVWGQFKIINP